MKTNAIKTTVLMENKKVNWRRPPENLVQKSDSWAGNHVLLKSHAIATSQTLSDYYFRCGFRQLGKWLPVFYPKPATRQKSLKIEKSSRRRLERQ